MAKRQVYVYYAIDWKSIGTIENLLEVLEASNIVIPASRGRQPVLKPYLRMVDEAGQPYTPLFKEGDEFWMDGYVIAIVSVPDPLNPDEKISHYVSPNGILFYYCIAHEREALGVVELEEHRLADLKRFHREPFTTTPPPPTTLADAVQFILPKFKDFQPIMAAQNILTADNFSVFCHSQLSGGVAMQIRNELGLWQEGNELRNHFITVHGLTHPYNMSHLILLHVYKQLQRNIPETTIPETDRQ